MLGKSKATARLCFLKNKMKKEFAFVTFASEKFSITESRESRNSIKINFFDYEDRRITNIDVDIFIENIARGT